MSNRSVSAIPAWAAGVVRRSGLGVSALAVLVLTWTGASVDVRADTFVLKSGEEIEGTILDATRNTVIIGPSIGGMRQMAIRDIDEIRVDLARGEQLSGKLMSWADGIYQLRSGDEVIRIGEGAVLSREPRTQVTEQPPQEPPGPEEESPTGLAAASPQSDGEEQAAVELREDTSAPDAPTAGDPAPTRAHSGTAAVEAPAARGPAATGAEEERETAAADVPDAGELAAPDPESRTAAVEAPAAQKQAATEAEDERETAAADVPDAGELAAPGAESGTGAVEAAAAQETAGSQGARKTEAAGASDAEVPAAIKAQEQVRSAAVDSSASDEPAAPNAKDESLTVAVKTAVGPTENGADGMIFKIELSRPAEQTVVLIYGTLDGTAKAGTDYEPQEGVLTLAPGAESGEIQVPLLEHQPSQGDKQFELFLMADPKVAEVVDKRIVATIDGDD